MLCTFLVFPASLLLLYLAAGFLFALATWILYQGLDIFVDYGKWLLLLMLILTAVAARPAILLSRKVFHWLTDIPNKQLSRSSAIFWMGMLFWAPFATAYFTESEIVEAYAWGVLAVGTVAMLVTWLLTFVARVKRALTEHNLRTVHLRRLSALSALGCFVALILVAVTVSVKAASREQSVPNPATSAAPSAAPDQNSGR